MRSSGSLSVLLPFGPAPFGPPPSNGNCFVRPAGTRIESRVTSAATSLCKESVSWAILSHTSLAVASLSGRPSGGAREGIGEGGVEEGRGEGGSG